MAPPPFDPLQSLFALALDLRWTWSHAADALWRRLDAERWDATHNPWHLLNDLPTQQLEVAVRDPALLELLRTVSESRTRDHDAPCWCELAYGSALPRRIAYFSMEFGLGEALPLYAGGLGVLAGDTLKGASDLGLAMTGVGLLYQEGYFRQAISSAGDQLEIYAYNDPASLPIQRVRGADGGWLHVPVRFPGRTIRLRAWRANVGRVPLYLLDSNDPLNSPADRGITGKLYAPGREVRLMQEILLGVGGWRLLEALGIGVDVCHLNEGHVAFATLERARHWMHRRSVPFNTAVTATRAGNIFTTHTPTEAGFDRHEPDLVCRYLLDDLSEDTGCSTEQLLALGRKDAGQAQEPFNMAYLAVRTSFFVNGVSELHGATSRRLFQPLFPRRPEREVPIDHVTNGVHVPSWDSAWSDSIWTEACGKARWRGPLDGLRMAVEIIPDEVLWSSRTRERVDLIEYARSRLARRADARNGGVITATPDGQTLKPDVLTLGFARRFTAYKRPNLLLHDPARLVRLLSDPVRAAQIVIAGKAHPADTEGKRLLRDWIEFARRPEVRGRILFLEDYDISLAQQLVQGVDVWISTPRRPWEASGTSGMKVLVNGGLNLSSLDGWWAEAFTPDAGWAIGTDDHIGQSEADARDAGQLYAALEQQIVPLFYERDASGIPRAWIARIRASMARHTPRYSTNRMLRDYLEKAYIPAAAEFQRRSDDHTAKAIAEWKSHIRNEWPTLRFGPMNVRREGDQSVFSVQVSLGRLLPEDIRVELYADSGCGDEGMVSEMKRTDEPSPHSAGTFTYVLAFATKRAPDAFTARIVPHFDGVKSAIEMPVIHWHH